MTPPGTVNFFAATTETAAVTELLPIIDKAANQSDRWLFLAMLVIVLLIGWMVVKYLVGRIDKSETNAKAEIKELSDFQRNTLTKLVVDSAQVIERSSAALEDNTHVLEWAKEARMRRSPIIVPPGVEDDIPMRHGT